MSVRQTFVCVQDLALVWAGKSYGPSWARLTRSSSDELKTRYRIAASIIDTWNIRYFIRRGVEVFLYRGRECRSGQRFGPESGRLPVDDDGVLPGRGGPACEEYACYLTRRALCGDRPGPPRSLCGLYDLVDAAGLDLSWDDLLVHARDSRSSLGGPHTHRGTDGSPESDCVHEPGLSDSHLGHGSQKPVGQDSLPTPLLLHAATLKGLASALPNGPRSDGTPPEVPPGESPPAPAAFSRPNLIDAAQRAAWLSERVAGQSAFEMLKIGDMDALAGGPPPPMPAVLEQHGVHDEDWARLMHVGCMIFFRYSSDELKIQDVSAVWTSGPPTDPRSDAGALVDRWNSAYFFGRGVEVRLCEGGSGPVDGLLLLLGADGAADAFTLYVTRRAFLGSPDAGSVGGREGLHVAGRPTLSGEDSGVRSSAAVTAGDAPDIRTPTASLAARELDGRQGALQGYHIFTVPSPFFRPVALPGRFPPFPPTKVRARDAFPVAPVAADDDDDDDDDRDGREERSSAIWAILEGHDVDLEDWTRFMHVSGPHAVVFLALTRSRVYGTGPFPCFRRDAYSQRGRLWWAGGRFGRCCW